MQYDENNDMVHRENLKAKRCEFHTMEYNAWQMTHPCIIASSEINM